MAELNIVTSLVKVFHGFMEAVDKLELCGSLRIGVSVLQVHQLPGKALHFPLLVRVISHPLQFSS